MSVVYKVIQVRLILHAFWMLLKGGNREPGSGNGEQGSGNERTPVIRKTIR